MWPANSTTPGPAAPLPGTQHVPRRNILAFDLATGAAQNLLHRILERPGPGHCGFAGRQQDLRWRRLHHCERHHQEPDGRPESRPPARPCRASPPPLGARSGPSWLTAARSGSVGTFANVGSASRQPAGGSQRGQWRPAGLGAQRRPTARSTPLRSLPTRSKVVVGGAFTTLNGSNRPGYGLGMVDAVSGANLATPDQRRGPQRQVPTRPSCRSPAMGHRSTARATSLAPAATWKARLPPTGRTHGSNGSRTATATPTARSPRTPPSTLPATRTTAATLAATPKPHRGPGTGPLRSARRQPGP